MATTMETQSQQHRPAPAKSAGLTNILNQDDQAPNHGAPSSQLRDSGFYSTTEASSKRMPFATLSIFPC